MNLWLQDFLKHVDFISDSKVIDILEKQHFFSHLWLCGSLMVSDCTSSVQGEKNYTPTLSKAAQETPE